MPAKLPKTVEKTGKQTQVSDMAAFMGARVVGFQQAPPATLTTYRRMRADPTVALARAVATAPIMSAKYSVEAVKGVPDDRIEFVREEIDPIWPTLIKDMLLALDFGFQAFEKVWMVNEAGRLVYRKIKPLNPDDTEITVVENTGTFAGIKQKDVQLGVPESFVYTHDMMWGNYYGRSRHENIREQAWHPWIQVNERAGKYAAKVAGVIPMIEYPVGESQDAAGQTVSNFTVAQRILTELGNANGVAMPNTLSEYMGDLLRAGAKAEDLKAWRISFLEAKGQHGGDFTDMLRYYDSQKMRGWLVPERVALEGQFGTKAEAGVQTGTALTVATLTLRDVIRHINWYIVNPLLVYNYGREAENGVYLTHAGLDPAVAALFDKLVTNVLGNPANVDLWQAWLDVDALLDAVGLPKSEAVVDPRELPAPTKTPKGDPDEPAEDTPTPEQEASRRAATIYRGLHH